MRYVVVDVFTEEPLAGNQLAVFPDASGLDEGTMQRIARELNLAETSFVLPPTRPDCAARVRIFTPGRELPFAGHPTIGTAFVLLHEHPGARGRDAFLLEEGVGPVPVTIEDGSRPLIWLLMPPVHEGRVCDAGACASALGLAPDDLLAAPPQLLSAGNPTLVVAVRDPAAVDRSHLDLAGLAALGGAGPEPFCAYVFTPQPDGVYARMFAPGYGITEDSATGSSMGPLAVFMMRHGLLATSAGARFVCEQGTKMGRRSLLQVDIRGRDGADGIYVGGFVSPIIEAVLTLPR